MVRALLHVNPRHISMYNQNTMVNSLIHSQNVQYVLNVGYASILFLSDHKCEKMECHIVVLLKYLRITSQNLHFSSFSLLLGRVLSIILKPHIQPQGPQLFHMFFLFYFIIYLFRNYIMCFFLESFNLLRPLLMMLLIIRLRH